MVDCISELRFGSVRTQEQGSRFWSNHIRLKRRSFFKFPFSEDSDSDSDSDISMTNDPAVNTKSILIKALPKRAGGTTHPEIVVLDNNATARGM